MITSEGAMALMLAFMAVGLVLGLMIGFCWGIHSERVRLRQERH